jgi:hypothetical protein
VPRQITPVETKTIAHGVEQAADDMFRLGILAANAGHQAAALLGGKVSAINRLPYSPNLP